MLGTNTDGIGARLAIEALLEESISLKRVGVLGYGATARAILAELHDNDVYSFVWGRDEKRVADACARFEAEPWPADNPPEIVISTLPPGIDLDGELLHDLHFPDLVFDANYGERSTLGLTSIAKSLPAKRCWRPKRAPVSTSGSRTSKG